MTGEILLLTSSACRFKSPISVIVSIKQLEFSFGCNNVVIFFINKHSSSTCSTPQTLGCPFCIHSFQFYQQPLLSNFSSINLSIFLFFRKFNRHNEFFSPTNSMTKENNNITGRKNIVEASLKTRPINSKTKLKLFDFES